MSESRPGLNRWYVVDVYNLTCEVDVSQLIIPPWLKIDPDSFYCEDHKRNKGLCYHMFIGALAEAARVDKREFPEEEH